MTTQSALDQAKLETFIHKVMSDPSATFATVMCTLRDRIRLFKGLGGNEPATSVLASAGDLEHDPVNHHFLRWPT
ncbi:MAG: hypothetical protein HY731_03515 [Candidatus Tectomicrobia bacterium]|nr:hypothetical protein [Candidatus Tectomicrobia bacterium]